MNFNDIPDTREEGDMPLRQAQNIMLRELRIFDRICREHHLTYWLDSGTLLGAVRHGGFIPWDDDLDVAMLREDYDKFRRIAAEALPDDLFFQTTETDPDYGEYQGKIRDRFSTIIEDRSDRFHQGIFMDIFPMDLLSEDPEKARKEARYSSFLYLLKHPMKSSDRWYYLLVKKAVFLAGCLVPVKSIKRKIRKMQRRYTLKDRSHISYGLDSFLRDVFSMKDVFPLKKMTFEGYEFPVPVNTDSYLIELFGKDYMQLPPENSRKQHALDIRPLSGHGHRECRDWKNRQPENG